MTPQVIPGAGYGEFWPSGVGFTSLNLPAGLPFDLLHFRVSSDGRVVGKGHVGSSAWYWNTLRWIDLGPSAGNNVAAFHPTSGEVYVSNIDGVRVYNSGGDFLRLIPGYVGANGIRWINPDGSIVSGDATYILPWRLGEHYAIPGGYIGQGLSGGLQVVFRKDDPEKTLELRHFCDGNVLFLRVNVDGDRVTCYWTDFANGYLINTTLTDLRALPAVTSPVPPVEPPPMADLNLMAEVQAERDKYPKPLLTIDQPAKILNAVAWRENQRLGSEDWGLSVKRGGNRVPSPQGIDVAYDILHHKPTNKLFGCFTDELKATVNWGEENYHGDPDGRPWLAPIPPDDVPPAPPPANTHRYMGGGNDTGTCDQCGRAKGDAVHRVPEGQRPHAPWQGEDGAGDCDLCFQPVDAAIHTNVVEPPPIPPVPNPPTGDLAAALAALELRVMALERRPYLVVPQ